MDLLQCGEADAFLERGRGNHRHKIRQFVRLKDRTCKRHNQRLHNQGITRATRLVLQRII